MTTQGFTCSTRRVNSTMPIVQLRQHPRNNQEDLPRNDSIPCKAWYEDRSEGPSLVKLDPQSSSVHMKDTFEFDQRYRRF